MKTNTVQYFVSEYLIHTNHVSLKEKCVILTLDYV